MVVPFSGFANIPPFDMTNLSKTMFSGLKLHLEALLFKPAFSIRDNILPTSWQWSARIAQIDNNFVYINECNISNHWTHNIVHSALKDRRWISKAETHAQDLEVTVMAWKCPAEDYLASRPPIPYMLSFVNRRVSEKKTFIRKSGIYMKIRIL